MCSLVVTNIGLDIEEDYLQCPYNLKEKDITSKCVYKSYVFNVYVKTGFDC